VLSFRPAQRLLCAGLLFLCAVSVGEQRPVTPLLWGFDDIGVRGSDCWNEGCLTEHPKAGALLREFGFNLWVTWYPDAACTWDTARNRDYIRKLEGFSDNHELHWVVNPLGALWDTAPEGCVDPQGFDWYLRKDGRRFFLFPQPLLAELGQCDHLLGVLYDEPEHHQGNANAVMGCDHPAIYDPGGDALTDAADAHVQAAQSLAEHYGRYGIPLFTEQVFPVMFHDFAAAGFTPGTKVLKEAWSPVYMACALGAAYQYGTALWVSPDLWGIGGYPDHDPDEYRSALLLAYHLGADAIYTESLALDQGGQGVGSLVRMTAEDYEVTPLGEVAKWFIKEHVPAHPRHYRTSDLCPRVAVIRQEDGCWGQRNAPHTFTPDRLFGNENWRNTELTEAWLDLWHLLTNGVVPRGGPNWFTTAHQGRDYQVFCPLDGVVVLDHKAKAEHLAGVEVVFLTGIGISETTLHAVRERVAGGATCVTLPHLAPTDIRNRADEGAPCPEGEGLWLLSESFLSAQVKAAIARVLPKEDAIRYRFGGTEVTLRPTGGDPNKLSVRVTVGESRAD